MSVHAAALFALALMGLLFGVAALADKRLPPSARRGRMRHGAYTLSLGVYCSSWTIYGAVGSAVREGWSYLPIYLAPICVLVCAPGFIRRLANAVAEEQATTVSDFLAARFGHDAVVARLVTAICLAGSVPYMALQLRSLGMAMSIVTGQGITTPTMVVAAILLVAFAILFGARRFEVASRSEGMVYAMGVESLIKIASLAVVAGVAVLALVAAPAASTAHGLGELAERFRPVHLSLDTGVIALISAMAVLALPRQFYMAQVEARDARDLPAARLGLAAYLTFMALMVLPIALAGASLLDARVAPDLWVLQLPLAAGYRPIVAVALMGGISAAAAMVITDATALATMVSNDLVFPTLLRSGGRQAEAGALGRRMLLVRRVSICAIVALALAWALLVAPGQSLASIGLVAFAAMAQFTPHLLLATGRRRHDAMAARASLATGFALWLYTLALPPILPESWRLALAGGLFDPLRLFGIGHAAPLLHGVAWSLGANIAVFAATTARRMPAPALPRLVRWHRQVSDLAGLVDLTASFVGRERAEREFPEARRGLQISARAAQRARKLIGGVVGTSSARTLVASALAGGTMSLAEVTRLLDERGQSLGFSRQLLAATFEHIDAGISVVDASLNLVAWNTRYEQLFDYPPGMLYVGVPVADLIRHNALRGHFGPGDVEPQIARRLNHLRRGMVHVFERRHGDGRVIKTVGGSMPGGGYVTSYTDITEEASVREELERTLASLEQRVEQRTAALTEANRQLQRATADKTRFLAAASHDLLQPLHAARLFTAALARDVPESASALVGRVDSAILAAEDLLRALLDISKLDAGGVRPRPEALALAPFLTGLVEGLRPMADAKGLRLRLGALVGEVCTDPGLLRSLLQNFIVNALRYTPAGGVLVGARRRAGPEGQAGLRIDVVDSGIGIPPDQIEAIFGEFTRLGAVEAEGLGLGLALSERIARLLGARIEVASNPGRGSRFSLWLPLAPAAEEVPARLPAATGAAAGTARALCVLVLDNDPLTVEATSALLASLGHRPQGAGDGAAALALAEAHRLDAVLADYRLDATDAGGENGLGVVAALRRRHPGLPAVLITAESGGDVAEAARLAGVPVLAKPVAPERLEAFLAGVCASA